MHWETNEFVWLSLLPVLFTMVVWNQTRNISGACLQGHVVVAQLLSHVQEFVTPWNAAHQAPLSSTISWRCPLSQWCYLNISLPVPSSPPALSFPRIRVFSIESALHIMWPKYWSFNFSINPSNEYSGLISFRIFWFDFLAVQGTLKS